MCENLTKAGIICFNVYDHHEKQTLKQHCKI